MGNAGRKTRNNEITTQYFAILDQHLAQLVSGEVTEMMRLDQIANELCISAKHLSQTIQFTQGQHPCHFYDKKILEEAKKLLAGSGLSVAEIAGKLTYDPSNFSKFFKKYAGETPGQYRERSKKRTIPKKVPKSSP